jgi:catechol 2,3-dioxygenase-like lactoylglutathione lyase family enzyme
MTMLGNCTSSAIVAVSDIDRAKQFYAGTLGLEPVGDSEDATIYRTGATRLIVYPSEHAGGTSANAVVFDGPDNMAALAAELRGKGVVFEEYPELGMEIVDGVHVAGGFKGIWFKDPDGNILHIVKM